MCVFTVSWLHAAGVPEGDEGAEDVLAEYQLSSDDEDDTHTQPAAKGGARAAAKAMMNGTSGHHESDSDSESEGESDDDVSSDEEGSDGEGEEGTSSGDEEDEVRSGPRMRSHRTHILCTSTMGTCKQAA